MWHLTKNIFSNIFFKIWPKMTNVKERISPMYSGLPVVTTQEGEVGERQRTFEVGHGNVMHEEHRELGRR